MAVSVFDIWLFEGTGDVRNLRNIIRARLLFVLEGAFTTPHFASLGMVLALLR
jgi:hypothetical protein